MSGQPCREESRTTTFSFHTTEEGPTLFATASGPFDVSGLCRIFDIAGAANRDRGVTGLLLDMRDVAPPRDAFDRFATAVYAAEKLGYRVRVALVWRAEHITGFGECAAINRGGDHRLFTDRPAALSWLREKAPR